MNIQELATLQGHQFPVKCFVANNDGYASIRASQTGYFKLLTGADRTSGVTLPDLGEVAKAYGFPFVRISDKANLRGQIRSVLEMNGPVVCEVMVFDVVMIWIVRYGVQPRHRAKGRGARQSEAAALWGLVILPRFANSPTLLLD